MKNITNDILLYRDCCSLTWKAFCNKYAPIDWNDCDFLADIGDIFFVKFVLCKYKIRGKKAHEYDANPRPLKSISVFPNEERIVAYCMEKGQWNPFVPKKINRFSFVNLYDFEICTSERKFDFVMTALEKDSSEIQYVLFHIGDVQIYYTPET